MREYELTQEAIEYVCSDTHYFKDMERTREICKLRLQGKTFLYIGKVFNLHPSRCQEICARVARIYKSALKNGKVRQEVKWRWEYGLCLPFCPYCDNPAYEEDHCVFCHNKYNYTESPVQDTVVEVGDYTIIQLHNNAIYIYKGKQIVMHASSAKKMTEDELREFVKQFAERSGR